MLEDRIKQIPEWECSNLLIRWWSVHLYVRTLIHLPGILAGARIHWTWILGLIKNSNQAFDKRTPESGSKDWFLPFQRRMIGIRLPSHVFFFVLICPSFVFPCLILNSVPQPGFCLLLIAGDSRSLFWSSIFVLLMKVPYPQWNMSIRYDDCFCLNRTRGENLVFVVGFFRSWDMREWAQFR